jgi:type I restriction enzyme S subunit
MVIAGYIIRVRTNEKANTEYISGFLNSKYGKTTLFEMCKSIVGQANINAQELQSISLPLPPIDKQNEYAIVIEKILAQKSRLQASLAELETTYKSTLQKAFNGELFQ